VAAAAAAAAARRAARVRGGKAGSAQLKKCACLLSPRQAEDTYFEADHNLRISKNSPYFFNISTNTRS
jgi:hypothetical protein